MPIVLDQQQEAARTSLPLELTPDKPASWFLPSTRWEEEEFPVLPEARCLARWMDLNA